VVMPTGYQPLREAIASHIGIVQGRCTVEPIVIVSDQPKYREP
jgi:hypothetical protein